MKPLHACSVFFARNAEDSLRFYTGQLGFTPDWNHQENGRAFACQVSLPGFRLILNQAEPGASARAGCGRRS